MDAETYYELEREHYEKDERIADNARELMICARDGIMSDAAVAEFVAKIDIGPDGDDCYYCTEPGALELAYRLWVDELLPGESVARECGGANCVNFRHLMQK